MKRYRVNYYFNSYKSKIVYLTELSKTEKRDGVRISFWEDGRKCWQDNWKNGLLNGIIKECKYNDSKNWTFRNYKKAKRQGIQIQFK